MPWHAMRDDGREAAEDQAGRDCEDGYHCLHRVPAPGIIPLTLIGWLVLRVKGTG